MVRHFPGSSYRINLEPTSAAEFDETCKAVAKGWRLERADWETRHVSRAATRTPTAWLEWHVYVLVEYLLSADLEEAWAKKLRDLSRRGAGDDNIFRQALRIIFAGEGNALSRQDRARIATRLECAYWHFVPPEFLIAFLRDAGASPRKGKVICGYESWVAGQLHLKRNRHFMDCYPASVRKSAKKSQRKWREEL